MRTFPDALAFIGSAAHSALVGRRVLNCLWELTYRCNARCGICPYWRRASDPAEELQLGEIAEGLDRLHAHGCRVVNFTGGEPLLRRDLAGVVRHASLLGMWTSIVTNGSLLTRERIHELKAAGLDNLFVSLDSPHAAVHDGHRGIDGAHRSVLAAIRLIGEHFLTGHRTGGIMCVVSRLNRQDLPALVDVANEFGVFVVFQPYHDNKTGDPGYAACFDDDLASELLALKRRTRSILNTEGFLRGFARFDARASRACHAGFKYFSVDPFGGVHPCVDMPRVGHVLRDDLAILRSPDAQEAIRACRGCWYTFRGEADCALTTAGCLEKLRLAWSVLRRNATRGRRDPLAKGEVTSGPAST